MTESMEIDSTFISSSELGKGAFNFFGGRRQEGKKTKTKTRGKKTKTKTKTRGKKTKTKNHRLPIERKAEA